MLQDLIPNVQKLSMPNQLASLSIERINFGHVPLGVTLRQIVVIQNISTEAEISFNWTFPSLGLETDPYLKILPLAGRLQPGESRVCKLIFNPKKQIRIYNVDVVCEILNETENVRGLALYTIFFSIDSTVKLGQILEIC
jgi:cilia- and flagella-associated protein 65